MTRDKPRVTSEWPDCGTDAAYQRHRRRHERPCTSCRQASARRRHGQGQPGRPVGRLMVDDPRPVRNGIPERPYAWHARSYPWAQRALAAAEAVHGRPEDGEAA